MKKLIITLFCIFTFAFCLKTYSQVDTANWSFKTNGSDGKYTMLQNRGTFQGKAAGTVIVPFTMDINAVDTSKFLFVPIGSDGTYRLVENKSTFMGKDSGTVRAQLTYGIILPSYSGTPTTTQYETPSNYYGSANGVVLGEPAKWVQIIIDGVIYIIPCYAIQ